MRFNLKVFLWLVVTGRFCNHEVKSSLDLSSSFVFGIDHNSESISVHWWVNSKSSCHIIFVSCSYTRWEPLTILMVVPCFSIILGELELNSIDESIFAAVGSLHQNHGTCFVEIGAWNVDLPPLLNTSLSFGIMDSSLGVKPWVVPILVPVA